MAFREATAADSDIGAEYSSQFRKRRLE